MQKKKTGQKSASLQKHCWDTHTSLVLLSLTTSCSQNYTQTKWWPAEKKESTATIWLWGMCSCSFLRGCFGQTGMNILTSCVCVESFIYRLWPEKSSSDPFHFPRSESHSASVPTVSQMSIYRSLWHKSPLLSKSTVCIIRQTSFPSSLWVQKT